MSIATVIIAAAFLLLAAVLSFALPHPITWLATAALGLLFFAVLLPQYQGQQQALRHGQTVWATVSHIRHWQHKVGDGHYQDKYEITALWSNPTTGKMVTFISPPLREDPTGKIGSSIAVTVNPNHPKHYVMQLGNMKTY